MTCAVPFVAAIRLLVRRRRFAAGLAVGVGVAVAVGFAVAAAVGRRGRRDQPERSQTLTHVPRSELPTTRASSLSRMGRRVGSRAPSNPLETGRVETEGVALTRRPPSSRAGVGLGKVQLQADLVMLARRAQVLGRTQAVSVVAVKARSFVSSDERGGHDGSDAGHRQVAFGTVRS